MGADHRDELRQTFGEVAALYERARPRYPAELLDDLAGEAGLGPGSRVLEIGCGTGQVTVPLAERGCAVVAVELSDALAAVARGRLAGFTGVHVVTAAFETWPLPAEPFEAVVAATSFHWLDPALRVQRCAQALGPGGTLAIASTFHLHGGSAEFFAQAQGCYARFMPAGAPRSPAPQAERGPAHAEEVERAGAFGPVWSRRYEAEIAYSTAEYLALLRTYSDHRALGPERLEGLLGSLAELIEDRFGGCVRKRYGWELVLARRRAGPGLG